MEIRVTKEDIRLGRKYPTSQTKCPVGRALRRAGFKKARVGVACLQKEEDGDYLSIRLPGSVPAFIGKMHGHEKKLKPFSFKITKKHVDFMNQ